MVNTHINERAQIRVLAWPAFSNRASNPYNSLLYDAMQKTTRATVTDFRIRHALKEKWDILHIHWPESMFDTPHPFRAITLALTYAITIFFMKIRGTKVIWTAHNLREHDPKHPRISGCFWTWFVNQTDGVILLTEKSREQLFRLWPKLQSTPTTVTPHGHYKSVYEKSKTRSEARRQLGIPTESPVAVFIGAIRPYKNVEQLIALFKKLPDPQARLIIAGRVQEPMVAKDLLTLTDTDSRILPFLEFVPDSDIQTFVVAADLMVFPYRDILNSGSVYLALSFDRPALVPRLGSMPELEREFGSKWIKMYDGDLSSEQLYAALGEAHAEPSGEIDSSIMWEWDQIAETTIRFYMQVQNSTDSECHPEAASR